MVIEKWNLLSSRACSGTKSVKINNFFFYYYFLFFFLRQSVLSFTLIKTLVCGTSLSISLVPNILHLFPHSLPLAKELKQDFHSISSRYILTTSKLADFLKHEVTERYHVEDHKTHLTGKKNFHKGVANSSWTQKWY